MSARTQISPMITVKKAAQVIAANSTVAFDFGTPDDIDMRTLPVGSRIIVHLTAVRAAGTTSTLQLNVTDAADSSGSIGTPAAASVTSSNAVIAAGDAGLSTRTVSLKTKTDRPWLQLTLTHAGGGTDSFNAVCTVFAIPAVV